MRIGCSVIVFFIVGNKSISFKANVGEADNIENKNKLPSKRETVVGTNLHPREERFKKINVDRTKDVFPFKRFLSIRHRTCQILERVDSIGSNRHTTE